MVHLWLVGKRVVDFLIVLIEFFSLAITVDGLERHYEHILVEIVVLEMGVGHFSANLGRKGASPTNDTRRQKTRAPGLS